MVCQNFSDKVYKQLKKRNENMALGQRFEFAKGTACRFLVERSFSRKDCVFFLVDTQYLISYTFNYSILN
jgi:hypothetical protein